MDERLATWELPPSRAELALVSGGTSDLFISESAHGEKAACVLRLYAARHRYALYVERNLSRWADRRVASWGKIRLMRQLLLLEPRAVLPRLLAWIDLDVVLLMPHAPLLERLLLLPNCSRGLVGPGPAASTTQLWAQHLPSSGNSSAVTFWASRDIDDRFALNVNSGVVAFRSGALALRFLEDTWAIGQDPDHFRRHDRHWGPKQPSDPRQWRPSGFFGWPFEQGAMWDAWTSSRSSNPIASDPLRATREPSNRESSAIERRAVESLCVAEPGWLQRMAVGSIAAHWRTFVSRCAPPANLTSVIRIPQQIITRPLATAPPGLTVGMEVALGSGDASVTATVVAISASKISLDATRCAVLPPSLKDTFAIHLSDGASDEDRAMSFR